MLYWGLIAVIFLEYVRPSAYVPGMDALRLNTIFPILVVLGAFLARTRVPNEDVAREHNTHILMFFLLMVTVSLMTATVTLWAWNMWKAVCGYVLLGLAAMKIIDTRERLSGVFKAFVLIHLLVAILNPQVLLDPSHRGYTGSPFLGDGNDFSLSLNIAVPMGLYLVSSSLKASQRWFYGAVTIVLVLCIVATQSRGGTIALAGVGIYYWFRSAKKLQTATLLGAVIVAVLLFAPPEYYERMNSISTEEGSAQGRIEAWKGAFAMAVDSPLLGFGAGHFAFVYGADYRTSLGGPHVQTAHSIYFLALGEFGFPGILLLLYFLGSNFSANARLLTTRVAATDDRYTNDRSLLAAMSGSLLGFAVAGAFLSALYYPHWYLLAGILGAGRRLVRETATSDTAVGPVATKPALTYHWALQPRPAAHLPANAKRQLPN